MENDKWLTLFRTGDVNLIAGVDPGAGSAYDVHEVRKSMLFENARSRAGTITARANHRRWFC